MFVYEARLASPLQKPDIQYIQKPDTFKIKTRYFNCTSQLRNKDEAVVFVSG
jgi:hypothetical protein